MIKAGMDVARVNFSHGTYAEHEEAIRRVREISHKEGKPLAILQDLQGPKIRVGEIRGGSMELKEGEEVVLTSEPVVGSKGRIPTTYPNLARDIQPGHCILLDDGLMELKVLQTDGHQVRCRVTHGGILKSHKGINLPGVLLSTPALTEKDLKDLLFGIQQKVDYVALSFVRRPEDIQKAQEALQAEGADIPVIAKLEKPEAIEHLDKILEVSDGVMVARGDLGVEMSPEKVPVIQKRIIQKARARGIPVITATQMLDSMRFYPRPTRAEASDVANAIFDGTDAVMLSGETAVGAFPVESVHMMARIIEEAELYLLNLPPASPPLWSKVSSFPEAISNAACYAAHELQIRAIVAFTQSGFTAGLVARHHPPVPIIAFTPNPNTLRRLCLYWGVTPRMMEKVESIDEMIDRVDQILLQDGLAKKGEAIIILCGTPLAVKGTTNLMTLHRVGEKFHY